MRVVAAVVAVLVAAGVTGVATSMPSKEVSLTITYWADEDKPRKFTRWTLLCDPLGGTLPKRRRACAKLSTLNRSAFAYVPVDAVCTQIYGGPAKAVVKGTLGSDRIWASFRRRNGCEIARWNRFTPWLLPLGGADR